MINLILVPVIMVCALVGTVAIITGIRFLAKLAGKNQASKK